MDVYLADFSDRMSTEVEFDLEEPLSPIPATVGTCLHPRRLQARLQRQLELAR